MHSHDLKKENHGEYSINYTKNKVCARFLNVLKIIEIVTCQHLQCRVIIKNFKARFVFKRCNVKNYKVILLILKSYERKK